MITAAMLRLQGHAHLSAADQQRSKALIVADFKEFWRGHPTEAEFSAAMDRIVLFPEMLYVMVTEPR
jgi:hypothetical protein